MENLKTRNKTILILGPNPETIGGIATVNRNITNSQLLNNHYNFIMLSTWDADKKISSFIKSIFSLDKNLKSADLVHIDLSAGGSTFRKLFLSKLLHGKKYIVHAHSGRFTDFYKKSNSGIKKAIEKLLIGSERVICVSDSQLNDFKTSFPFLEKKIVRIYNGIDLTQKDIIQKDTDTFNVLYMGSILDRRHISEFLELSKTFTRQGINYYVAGDGEIDKSYGNHNATILGFVSGKEKEDLLSKADVLYDYFNESFGIGMVEAMNHSCCILGWNRGAIPEIIQNGECGILFNDDRELYKSIAELYNDKALLHRLQNNAFIRSKVFSLDSFYRQFDELYHEVLKSD